MELTADFYRDEVRYGFYVPTAIKQAWGAELMILAEIDRICEKHGIRYFAEWGTLIGAVRHGGFVPWDDDIDIGMCRADYERFKRIAAQELPKEFAIHDYASKENHWLFLSRVVNCNHICFEEDHLRRYHNFPYIATVDIFVLDYRYRDEDAERARCEEVKYILAVADSIIEQKSPVSGYRSLLDELSEKYQVSFSCTEDARQIGIELYRLAERQMARTPETEADTLVQMFPWGLKGVHGLPKQHYDRMIRMPFEQTTIPVPADYDGTVRARYGDYMTIHKVWGGHDYPYFEGQRKNLQAVADFALPEFTFQPDMLVRPERDMSQSLTAIGREYLRVLGEMTQTVTAACGAGRADGIEAMESGASQADGTDRMGACQTDGVDEQTGGAAHADECAELLAVLPELQQLAVDFGTLAEQVRGEDNPHVQILTAAVQEFCDQLYEMYVCVEGETDDSTGDCCTADDGSCDEGCTDPCDEACDDPCNETCADSCDDWNTDGSAAKPAMLCAAAVRLQAAYGRMADAAEAEIFSRRAVLFVTTGHRQWETLRGLCEAACADAQNDVFVTLVPTVFKDITGRAEFPDAEDACPEWSEWPDNARYMSWQAVNPALLAPEKIYIQDPYDGENPALTIPHMFYAGNLRRFTGELVYVPAYLVKEFGAEDATDICNMKYYVTAPALMYADTVVVQSENMRARYLEQLVHFAGEDTREVWERKLVVRADADAADCPGTSGIASGGTDTDQNGRQHIVAGTDGRRKKKILWCIGISEMVQAGEKFPAYVQSRLEIFAEHQAELDVDVAVYPPARSTWEFVNSAQTEWLTEKLRSEGYCRILAFLPEDVRAASAAAEIAGNHMVQASTHTGIHVAGDGNPMPDFADAGAACAETCDAYYGAPSPYVHEFTLRGKPVMLSDVNVG